MGSLTVRPGEEVRSGDRLTRRALNVTLVVGGQTLLDAVLGESSVGADGVTCGGAAQVAAEQALECTKRRLVLIGVLQRSGGVHLTGVADRRLIGRTVDIRFVTLKRNSRGRRVARVRVGRNGVFRTTAPPPPRTLRRSNRARGQAVLGRERSLRVHAPARRRVASVVLLVTFAMERAAGGAAGQGRRSRRNASRHFEWSRTQPCGDRRSSFPVERCGKGH